MKNTILVYIIIAIAGLSMLVGAKLKEISIIAENDRINKQILDTVHGR